MPPAAAGGQESGQDPLQYHVAGERVVLRSDDDGGEHGVRIAGRDGGSGSIARLDQQLVEVLELDVSDLPGVRPGDVAWPASDVLPLAVSHPARSVEAALRQAHDGA